MQWNKVLVKYRSINNKWRCIELLSNHSISINSMDGIFVGVIFQGSQTRGNQRMYVVQIS